MSFLWLLAQCLLPWRQPKGLARTISYINSVVFVTAVLGFFIDWMISIMLPALMINVLLIVVHSLKELRATKDLGLRLDRFALAMKVRDGEIPYDSLSPEQREDIAVEYARLKLSSNPPRRQE